MARPAKSVNVISKNLTNDEKKARADTEERLRGSKDKLKPASYLNKRQKEIFEFIINELEESKILGNLDTFVLNQTAIAIERLENLEKKANKDDNLFTISSNRSMREMYSKDFFRCCNELCLSPQSRAKLSISAKPPSKSKKLTDILGDDD